MKNEAKMTTHDMLSAFTSPILNEGVRQEDLALLNDAAGCSLPQSYIDLMTKSNGIEGFVGEMNYVVLWRFEQLTEANEGYGVKKFAPGFFLFGSNGGDAGYVFDTRRTPMPVLEVPFVGMSHAEAKLKGKSFEEFLISLRDG